MRGRFVCILCLVLFCFAGCAQNELPAQTVTQNGEQTAEAVTELQTEAEPTTVALPQDLPEVDFDLSAMSQTVMYAQVYDMIYNPDQYHGKAVRMLGPVDQYVEEETGETRCVCLIQDATACCTQGIEFELSDADAAVPSPGSTVLVSGAFDTYMSGPFLHCVLRDAALEYPPAS